MKFKEGEKVRVVSAGSNFFGWVGEVVASYDGDLVFGEKHYQVRMTWLTMVSVPPLLFREVDLAFAGE
jgi:hypothetical protein